MDVVRASVFALAVAVGFRTGPADDRLYGRVLTAEGEQLEGYLRWDRNEATWADFLDGRMPIPWAYVHERERLDAEFRRQRELERSLTVGNVRVTWDEDDEDDPQLAEAGIRFGQVRTLVADDDSAVVTTKSGERLTLRGGSSDVGRGFRGLVVEDRTRGSVELDWDDIDRVDFRAAPAGVEPPEAERLYGTLRTRDGLALTGFVGWDMDEALTSDILDGEEDGRDRDVPFGSISRIAPDGRLRARVTLRNGEQMVLRGTNDVNYENRGVEVSDPALGRAVVPWDELESVSFQAQPASVAPYGSFDGGQPLRGTVETRSAERLMGLIRWDNRERRTWGTLDGEVAGAALAIELSHVASVERAEDRGARVVLRDGRSFVLGGSSDVDADNGGVFVTPDGGDVVLVRWKDFRRVTFEP